MTSILLDTITKEQAGSVQIIEQEAPAPTFKGTEDTNYLCGKCAKPVAENVKKGSIQNLVIGCGHCKALNYFPPA